jgi:hypothetical protein
MRVSCDGHHCHPNFPRTHTRFGEETSSSSATLTIRNMPAVYLRLRSIPRVHDPEIPWYWVPAQ